VKQSSFSPAVADLVLVRQQNSRDYAMTIITKEKKLVTLINVFTVDPAKQHELVNLLARATESSVRDVPGFISASLHRGLDGTKVAMYAQWRSIEDYQAMRQNAVVLPYMQKAVALAKFEPGMYEVVETFEPRSKDA
jgi:quinol monooxygenase YgiN